MAWRLLQYKGAYDAFAATCDQAMLDALRPRLARLLEKGNLAGYPATEPLGGGLFELRARCKKVQMRLLFGFLPGQRIIVVVGTTKKSRVLPPTVLNAARVLLAEAAAMQERLDVVVVH